MIKFYPKVKKFNPFNMLLLAECADESYKDSAALQAWLTDKGFNINDNNYHFGGEESDSQYFIVATEEFIVLTFRGSELSTGDWHTNAHAFKDSWVNTAGAGRVHAGFENSLLSVWDKLYSQLLKLRNNGQSIWITGHSQGGAIAVLAASKLRHQNSALGKAVHGVYTFGQPRVGNDKFAKVFNSNWNNRCFRVVNDNDIVTRLPPLSWNYHHVGKLVFFDNKGKLRLGKGKGKTKRKSRSRWQRMWDTVRSKFEDGIANVLFSAVTDHFMTSYVNLCQQHVQGIKRKG